MFASAFQANAFQNNAFQIVVASNKVGGDDAWFSKEELKRIQKLEKKIAARQRLLEKSVKDANVYRKQSIRNIVDPRPIAKVKQSKVQSLKGIADKPSVDTKELKQSISYLERQLDNIQQAVAYRQEFARLQAHLRILEAKRLAEIDDEEALIFLM